MSCPRHSTTQACRGLDFNVGTLRLVGQGLAMQKFSQQIYPSATLSSSTRHMHRQFHWMLKLSTARSEIELVAENFKASPCSAAIAGRDVSRRPHA
jgi:hypothetical protein